MLGWAFFELSGGQDFQPVLARSVAENVAPTGDVDPIDRSFDREEVARAATNALRSIEFDDHAEAASHVNVPTDATLWKVSADTATSAIIENILDDMVPVVAAAVSSDENLYSVSVNRSIGRICAMGQARQRCHCEVGVRHRGSAVAQFIWIMGEIARRETNRVGWISKKLLEKAD